MTTPVPSRTGSEPPNGLDIRELAIHWTDSVWNQRRDATIDEMLAPDMEAVVEGRERPVDREAFKAYRARLLSAMPDLRIEVVDSTVDGNVVVTNWEVTGTHLGDGLGVPPTGRRVQFRGATWFVFRDDGLIAGGWDRWNQGQLIASLKAIDLPTVTRQFQLTPRQAEVAMLLTDRLTHKEVAKKLGIRPNTARRHIQRVLQKLGIHRKEDVAEVIRGPHRD